MEGWGSWEPGHQERRARPSGASARCGGCAHTRASRRRDRRRCGGGGGQGGLPPRDGSRRWLRRAERDGGVRPGPTTEERERIRALERENRELGQSLPGLDPGPTSSSGRPARVSLRRSSTADPRHDRLCGPVRHGAAIAPRPMPDATPTGSSRCPDQVGAQVCRVLPIAPQAHHAPVARRRDPARACTRARRDAELRPEIARVHAENFGLSRRPEGPAPDPDPGSGARCAARGSSWRGARWRAGCAPWGCRARCGPRRRGAPSATVPHRAAPCRTVPHRAAPCPLELVNRQFRAPAPDRLWGADFTRVATGAGFVHGALAIVLGAMADEARSSTPSRGGSSAGACRAPLMRGSRSMPWSRPPTRAVRPRAPGPSRARTADRPMSPSGTTWALGRGGPRALRGLDRRQLRHRAGRDRHRPLQDRR